MKLKITDPKTGGDVLLISGEKDFDRRAYNQDRENKYFTIAWNRGKKQTVTVDGAAITFMHNNVMPLMFYQSFYFELPEDIVAWQFNREFYCIVDHDSEVSCAGFLFVRGDQLSINLDSEAKERLQLLWNVFEAEFNTADHIQHNMVQMLLKRLIIFITQHAENKYIVSNKRTQDGRLDIFRKYNLLVEANFRSEHSVNFYAQMMHKSPKTLSNIFALYNDKTPLQIIQNRIMIEAKRLLYYTDKSVKQIAYELGFEDPAYFTTFFKRHIAVSPVEFRMDREKVIGNKKQVSN